MAVDRSGTAFARSFMAGFSFIDNAFERRRNEARLDQRLKDEQKQRAFENNLATQRNQRAAAQEDRAAAADQERRDRQAMIDEASAIFTERGIDGMSAEEIAKYAPYHQGIQQAMHADRAIQKQVDAFRTVQGLRGGVQAVNAADTGGDQLSEPEIAAEEAAAAGQSLFEPTRGTGGLRQVTGEDIAAFHAPSSGSDERPQIPLGSLATPSAMSNTGKPAPTDYKGGFISDEFVTAEEFSAINDPDERARVRARNQELISESERVASDPSNNRFFRISPSKLAAKGGEKAMAEARRAEEAVSVKYDDFLGPNESKLEQMAVENPTAASMEYFQDRETLLDARGPAYVAQVDARMAPVVQAYADTKRAELAQATPGTSEYRRLERSLGNVIASQNEMAASQPSVPKAAGIRNGMPTGNTQLVQSVSEATYGGDRAAPVYNSMPGQQVRSAGTMAGRVTPNTKRLSDKQIEALVTLSDAGRIDKATFEAVMMTGSWPQGKDPNAISKITSVNGWAVAFTEGGGYFTIPELSNPDINKTKPRGEDATRTFDTEKLNKVVEGALTQNPNMSKENVAAIEGFMLDYAPMLRQSHYLDSEENLLLLGRMYQQAQDLSKRSMEDGMLLTGWGGVKDRTVDELFFNQEMRLQYAENFEQRPVKLPERIYQSGYDAEAIRSELKTSGILAGRLSNEQIDQLGERDLIAIGSYLYATPDTFREE